MHSLCISIRRHAWTHTSSFSGYASFTYSQFFPVQLRGGSMVCRANEICRESKRQTINADDVLKAVEELDFTEFCEPLNAALAGNQFYLAAF